MFTHKVEPVSTALCKNHKSGFRKQTAEWVVQERGGEQKKWERLTT